MKTLILLFTFLSISSVLAQTIIDIPGHLRLPDPITTDLEIIRDGRPTVDYLTAYKFENRQGCSFEFNYTHGEIFNNTTIIVKKIGVLTDPETAVRSIWGRMTQNNSVKVKDREYYLYYFNDTSITPENSDNVTLRSMDQVLHLKRKSKSLEIELEGREPLKCEFKIE